MLILVQFNFRIICDCSLISMKSTKDFQNAFPHKLLKEFNQKSIVSEGNGSIFITFVVCKECFDFFDKDASGTIDKTELVTVMRAVGMNPSKNDVEKMIKSVAEKGKIVKMKEFRFHSSPLKNISKASKFKEL